MDQVLRPEYRAEQFPVLIFAERRQELFAHNLALLLRDGGRLVRIVYVVWRPEVGPLAFGRFEPAHFAEQRREFNLLAAITDELFRRPGFQRLTHALHLGF